MKPLARRLSAVALAMSLALPLGGCNFDLFQVTNPLEFFLVVFGGGGGGAKKKKKTKLKDKSDVEISGEIGGLDGTYDIDIGTFGNLTGVADIKGQFKAQIKLKEFDQGLADVIEAAALDRFGLTIDVTETKGKFKGRQTGGAVNKKIYSGVFKFEGTVTAGEDAGARVKGKIKLKGKFD